MDFDSAYGNSYGTFLGLDFDIVKWFWIGFVF